MTYLILNWLNQQVFPKEIRLKKDGKFNIEIDPEEIYKEANRIKSYITS
jgi:hypothetical protein